MSFFAPMASVTSTLFMSVLTPVALGTIALLSGCWGGGNGDGPPDAGSIVPPDNPDDDCDDCHTSPNDSPSSRFHMYGAFEELGAHNPHRNPTLTEPGLSCDRCHPVPTEYFHANGQVDIYTDGNDWITSYNPDTTRGSCLAYCHGRETEVPWRIEYERFQWTCTSCHNETEPAHNTTDVEECATCHDQTVNNDGSFKNLSLHVNGEINVGGDVCTECHGQPPEEHKLGITDPLTLGFLEACSNCHPNVTTPFVGGPDDPHRNGQVDFKEEGLCASCHGEPPTTGAHEAHNDPDTTNPIECTACHDVPSQESRLLEHLTPPIVLFGGLAVVNQHGDPLMPVYDSMSQGCSTVYCHGGGLYAGQLTEPILWSSTSGGSCGSCHTVPPTTETAHVFESCDTCHGEMTNDRHINGVVNGPTDESIENGCTVCHESPPANHLDGIVDPTIITLVNTCSNCHTDVTTPFETVTHRNGNVDFSPTLCASCHGDPPSTGAHDDHISPSLAWTIECTTCHDSLPTQDMTLFSHMSSPIVTFSGLATVNLHGPNPIVPVYDSVTKGCSTVYCHGGGLAAGQSSEVFWDDASGTQDDCGACHDMPPANPPHAPLTCTTCHSFFLHEHVNGTVNMLGP